MYVKNQRWAESKDDRISQDRAIKEEKSKSDLTFKPTIKKMVREQDIVKENLTAVQLKFLSPDITIPQDSK